MHKPYGQGHFASRIDEIIELAQVDPFVSVCGLLQFELYSMNICPTHISTSESEFVNLLWNLLKIESLAYAHKQHAVGLLTFAVIQTYLSDTCLES
jgi:hypothetical protein